MSKSNKLITPEHQANFCNVLEAKAFSADQDPKFSTVIALDKDDPFWKKLDTMMEEMAKEKWPDTPFKKIKTYIKEYTEDDEEAKYGWAGKRVFTASNKSPVGVLVKTDEGLVEPISKEDIYSGCLCRAAIRPYCFEFQKSKGIAISLDNFLKTGAGEKFTSKTTAEEDFADFTESDWD